MTKMHTLAYAALAAALFAAAPAYAQTTDAAMVKDCSEASMKSAEEAMMKMTDAAKKETVAKELHMAKDMMEKKKDEKGCMMQMEKAMGMMK